eukprot:COSAG04_NODE_1201_length_7768_cov_3.753944_8_plen_46_part_00
MSITSSIFESNVGGDVIHSSASIPAHTAEIDFLGLKPRSGAGTSV